MACPPPGVDASFAGILLHIDLGDKYVTFLVPKLHLPAHVEACQNSFSFNLPVVLPTFLTNVDVPTERPVVLYETLIGSLPVLETGANLGARIDNVDKEHAVLDVLVLDVLRNGGSGVVDFNLYATARGSEVGRKVGREAGEREEKTNRA
jgi:hypothetical protein